MKTEVFTVALFHATHDITETLTTICKQMEGDTIKLLSFNDKENSYNSEMFSEVSVLFVQCPDCSVYSTGVIKSLPSSIPNVPIIALINKKDEEKALELMHNELFYYLIIEELSPLSCKRALTLAQKTCLQDPHNHQINAIHAHSSVYDGLTQLLNRSTFFKRFSYEVEQARKKDNPLCCLLADIDHFKHVNTEFGHSAGDHTLITFAKMILQETRNSDIVARFGGEEFIICVTNTTITGAKELAERIRKRVENTPITVQSSKTLHITCSIGLSESSGDQSAADMINKADEALYGAKNAGRNRTTCWSDTIGIVLPDESDNP